MEQEGVVSAVECLPVDLWRLIAGELNFSTIMTLLLAISRGAAPFLTQMRPQISLEVTSLRHFEAFRRLQFANDYKPYGTFKAAFTLPQNCTDARRIFSFFFLLFQT
jgi:hypothetical protein